VNSKSSMFSKIKLSPVIVAIVNQNSYGPFPSHTQVQMQVLHMRCDDAYAHEWVPTARVGLFCLFCLVIQMVDKTSDVFLVIK
jgi:hypothetical protein